MRKWDKKKMSRQGTTGKGRREVEHRKGREGR
jgi:hypothetical protein